MSSDASFEDRPRPVAPNRGVAGATGFDWRRPPRLAVVLELFKPVTWFPPMWAFVCGVVSSGADLAERWAFVLGGVLLAGPLVCATSQAVNDWFDRHVDAINQPERPIPSGRLPGHWGLVIAIGWTLVSIAFASLLGVWAFVATLIGMAFAWAYSAPPLRLKRSGWLGPAAVAISYEGLAWFTGAAVMLTSFPRPEIVVLAALYSLGAHGIMVLNDFKAIEGDRQTGIRSLPVALGPERAAQVACVTMLGAQVLVVGCLVAWGQPFHAAVIALATLAQAGLMTRLLQAPAARAPWYNATGVMLYVLGMMIAAFAVRALPMGIGLGIG